jgi:small subunit ribosomal protein S17
MADDETTDETTDVPDEGANGSAEDSDASAGGPVAEEDSSSSQAAGEEPTSTPPPEEASEPEAEAPESEDEAAAPEPEADAAQPEPEADEPEADAEAPGREAAGQDAGAPASDSDGDDLPWKERRRLERSREPAEARPERSAEDRAGERADARRRAGTARRRYREGQRAKGGEAGTGTPPAERKPNPAKTRQGVVVSDRADKTITVRIDIARRHPTYEKVVRRSRTLHAHDERNEAGEGDIVRVIETRPLSRTKRWRLVEVVEKAR